MNPTTNIAPPMSTNEAARRLLNVFMDPAGNLRPGAPGGPVEGIRTDTEFVTAAGPLPTPAALLIGQESNRIAGMIINLDPNITIYWGSDPTITDTNDGSPLGPNSNVPITRYQGPIYVYTPSGSPRVCFTGVYSS